MKAWPLIFIFLALCGCAVPPAPVADPSDAVNPMKLNLPLGGAAPKDVFYQGNEQIDPASVLLPPSGITIPIPPALARLGSADYFTSTNLNGPWLYRTDDLYVFTNTDGTVTGSFSNAPPAGVMEFIMIVPVFGPYPLPGNIITNFTHV